MTSLPAPADPSQSHEIDISSLSPRHSEIRLRQPVADGVQTHDNAGANVPQLQVIPSEARSGCLASHLLEHELNAMTTVFLSRGHVERVTQRLGQWIRAYPEDVSLIRCFCDLFLQHQHVQSAVRWLFVLVYKLVRRDNIDGAYEALHQILELEPNHLAAHRICHALDTHMGTRAVGA